MQIRLPAAIYKHQGASKDLFGSVSPKTFDYISCQLKKQLTLPFNTSESIASASFDIIHYDVWGLSPIPSISSSCYFVIFLMIFPAKLGFFLIIIIIFVLF